MLSISGLPLPMLTGAEFHKGNDAGYRFEARPVPGLCLPRFCPENDR